MRAAHVVGLTGVMILVAGCAPSVTVTPLGESFAPRDGLEEVAVFSTQVPSCPYREIALLTAYAAEMAPHDLEAVLPVLRQRAREMGADAVINLQVMERGGEMARSGYSGTAIRFVDDGCTR